MLTNDNLVIQAIKAVPEFEKEYNRQISDGILDKDDGNHIVFSYAFVPILINAIKDNNQALQEKVFAFVERMAASQDHLVVEVCDYSILEALNDEFDYSTLNKLFGEKTKEGYEAIKQYMR